MVTTQVKGELVCRLHAVIPHLWRPVHHQSIILEQDLRVGSEMGGVRGRTSMRSHGNGVMTSPVLDCPCPGVAGVLSLPVRPVLWATDWFCWCRLETGDMEKTLFKLVYTPLQVWTGKALNWKTHHYRCGHVILENFIWTDKHAVTIVTSLRALIKPPF